MKQNPVYKTADYKGLSEAEKKIFRSVVLEMERRGMFQATDAPVIASYSRNVVLSRLAMDEVTKYGVLIQETDNYHGTKIRENPAIAILTKAQKAFEESALKLGITPVGRKRTKTEEVKPLTPEQTMLKSFLE